MSGFDFRGAIIGRMQHAAGDIVNFDQRGSENIVNSVEGDIIVGGISVESCPFCGSDTKAVFQENSMAAGYTRGMHSFVTCRQCGARGPATTDGFSAHQAWNIRFGE